MERIIKQITTGLTEQLPENQEYFRLPELRSLKFPSYIIQRMGVELERNLAESIQPPKTDWANMDTEPVQEAWDHFINAIRAEARLPASYAKTVIETSVADVMELLVQPRKAVPDIVFGAVDTLDYEEVLGRVKGIVVYRHFARLIPRYMEKRDMKQLSRDKCMEIVEKADRKMTEKYSPLNWAQMLEPLFLLTGEQIDTNLLRLFFEDKEMPRVARKFDLMDTAVSRAEFIEVLSSPELLNMEGYEQSQSELFDRDPVSGFHKSRDKKAERKPAETAPWSDEEGEDVPGEAKEDTNGDSINALFTEGQEEDDEPEKNTDSDESEEIESDEESFETEAAQEETEAKTEEAEESLEPEVSKEEIKEAAETKNSDQQAEEIGEQVQRKINELEDKTEVPMWARFLSEEEKDALDQVEQHEQVEQQEQEWAGQKSDEKEIDSYDREEDSEEESEEDSDTEEDGFIEDPIIDLTKEQGPDEENVALLEQQLEDDRNRFVEDIFRGSERAFEEALEEISAMDSWKTASKYIEKEIFKRNLVDMYSESAVDFTDRLQSYFLEKSKS